jgi:hypothetical protein
MTSCSQLDKISLHHAILRSLMDTGYAPTRSALTHHFGTSAEEVDRALSALQEYHGVVLHPHTPEVWVAHPFSTAPTCFVVRYGDRLWWGNCAWCSLGIAALLGGDGVAIETTIGAEGKPVTIHVDGGRVRESLLVHFPIPMTHVWDNVVYADSTVLVFESESQVNSWVTRHCIEKGDVQPIQRVYELAAAWYGRHLDEDWHKWTMEEARQIFTKCGLGGRIWDIPCAGDRF